MRTRSGVILVGTLVAIAAAAPRAWAQSGQTAQIPLQFDFLNPGARSLGMGSAFTAVADDATAAYTNPAGLTFLVKPEVSAEMRFRHFGTTFLSGGRLSGVITGSGVDTTQGPIYGNSVDSAFRPYYFSFVYPHGKLSVAGFRHELSLQSNTFLSQGPFQQSFLNTTVINNSRVLGLTGSRDLSVDNYGGAIAYRLSPSVSAGAEVSFYRFSDTSKFASLGFVSQFGAADPSTAGQASTTTQTGSATAVGINAGVLATINPKVRVGAVFRQGVSFDFTQVNTVPGSPTVTETGQFRTPMVIGGGLRVQANDELVVAVDYDRVTYSRLVKDFIDFQVDPSVLSRISIADGNEFHFGLEYTLTGVLHTPTIRGGAWFDPDHAVQYTSDFTNSSDDVRLKATFPGGKSIWHYCLGVGLPLSRNYEVNVGADLASERQYVAASIVARFGR
jgi:long-subunit fatty acid transport protein